MSSAIDVSRESLAKAALDEFRAIEAALASDPALEEKHKAARLNLGLYTQRQKEYYMTRTKVPAGALTPAALVRLANASEKYSNGHVHLTTRQDAQLHFVKKNEAADLLEYLLGGGVISLGAGGNSVRNVTACAHFSDEPGPVFDMDPLVESVTEFFLGHELGKGLPRKFKINFCSKPSGCGGGLTDDIAVFPVVPENGGQVHLKIYAGGGQGALPRLAKLLDDHVPVENLNASILAVIRVFNARGNRANRQRARLKFLIEKIGFEEFKRLYQEELRNIGGLEQLDINSIYEAADDEESRRVIINVPGGDLSSDQLRTLNLALKAYKGARLRVTKNADLVFSGFPAEAKDNVTAAVQTLGLPVSENGDTYVTSCNGAATCSEGITNSKGLAKRLEDLARGRFARDGLRVSVSGCHNACGNHHSADIGLQGSAKRVDGTLVPHYQVFIGGDASRPGKLAEPAVKIPSSQTLAAVERLTEYIIQNRRQDESVHELAQRLGVEAFEKELESFVSLPARVDEPKAWFDLDATEEFSLEEVGPGECAGSALDIIDGYFDQARRELHSAEANQDPGSAGQLAYKSAILSAKALLVKYGVSPTTDSETVEEFKLNVISRDESPDSWNMALLALSSPAGEEKAGTLKTAWEFFDKCHEAYALSSLPVAHDPKPAQEPEAVYMDLSGVSCPFNYTKIKLRMEMLPAGARIEALLDDGAPIRNVPRSLENDGHKVISIEPRGKQSLLLVEKAGW